MKANVKYMCVGENFRDGVQIGDLAKTKTLIEWLEYLFPTTNKEVLINYFKHDSNQDVCKYILETKGKRLEKHD